MLRKTGADSHDSSSAGEMSRLGSVEDLRRGIAFGRGYGKCESRLGDVGVADLTHRVVKNPLARVVMSSLRKRELFIGANLLKIILFQDICTKKVISLA